MEIEKTMIFSSRTMLGRDECSKILQVLQSLNNSCDSLPFRDPVNWEEFGLLDYPVIIKNPMDLSTIRKKVDTNRYEYVEDCLDDINLIWANAKVYNPKENQIHKLADKLEKQTKKMIKNYLPFIKIDTQAGKKRGQPAKKESKPAKPAPKAQEPKNYLEKQEEARIDNGADNPEPEEPEHIVLRKNLLYLMQLCNKDQIGVIFQLLLKNCPESIDYEEDGSVNIHGEKLDDKMANRLNELVELWGISLKNVIITPNPTKKK